MTASNRPGSWPAAEKTAVFGGLADKRALAEESRMTLTELHVHQGCVQTLLQILLRLRLSVSQPFFLKGNKRAINQHGTREPAQQVGIVQRKQKGTAARL